MSSVRILLIKSKILLFNISKNLENMMEMKLELFHSSITQR